MKRAIILGTLIGLAIGVTVVENETANALDAINQKYMAEVSRRHIEYMTPKGKVVEKDLGIVLVTLPYDAYFVR